MNAALRLIAFDFRLYFRDWMTLFWILIYPPLMLLIFGSMYGDQPGVVAGTRYIESYVAALCVMNVVTVSVFTLNINIVTNREKGNLRRYRATPLPVSAILASHSVQGLFLVLAGTAEILLIAKLVWDIRIAFAALGGLLAVLLLGCLGFFSLGFALSGLARTAGAASGLAMIVFFPMMFLSGVAMPVAFLPEAMQAIGKALPMKYLVEMGQGVWAGQSLGEFPLGLSVLAGFAVLAWALAFLLFRWENR
ncbi:MULTISPECIES: ABC transporter permease [Cohnella]|uniref:ABC transporter permease n=1 Tax=Cohnella TaxID=329857 RepID=UPI0009B931F0|nr:MULTISPECIES: ABC transporter permease [Cohnella]MBN2980924.1 ABC transporter permease [Cohnella algarum]